MLILHVITNINRGGAENHLAALVSKQVAQGFKVIVAYLKGDGYWSKYYRNLGVQSEGLGLRYYGEVAPAIKLRTLIQSTKPDIVHAHLPPAELYTRMALLLCQPAPLMIISKHNDEPFYRGPAESVVGHWVGKRAACIIAISNAVKNYICSHFRFSPNFVKTVHYGIDAAEYESFTLNDRLALLDLWGIPHEALVIGTVARFVPQKALHVLLHAYAQYRTMARLDSRLVVVGCGPLEQKLKTIASQLNLEDLVIWAGFREDIPSVMNAFDIFALTSVYEGFGLVLLEAMAASKPIVASRVSAIPEIVIDGATGYLCKAGSPEDFAQAFLRLEDSNLRTQMGRSGYDLVRTKFTVARMAEATLSVYKECLG